MRRIRIRPVGAIAIVSVLCTAVVGAGPGEAQTSGSKDDFSAAFGKLADRIGPEPGTRPSAARRRGDARAAGAHQRLPLHISGRPARSEDFEAALERLKATDRIGLRNAYKLSPDEDSLGLRIPLSGKTAIVPTYDVDHRDIGMTGTDGDKAHRFRIGASLRF